MKFLKFVLLSIFVCSFLSNCDAPEIMGNDLEPPKDKSFLSAPILQIPSNGAKDQPVSPALSWKGVEGAAFYEIHVSGSEDFSSLLVNSSTQKETYNLSSLSPEKTYYWKVRGIANDSTEGAWSESWSFTTVPETEETPTVVDTTKPEIKVSAPQSISEEDAITITASANDASGISKIEIYVDGSKVKACTNVTTCDFSTSYQAGTYAYYALAIDGSVNANSSQSETQQFTVTPNVPVKSTYKIMPLGDSITESTGYRLPLWNLLTGEGYSIDFVGSQSKPHPDLPDTDHEGHGGWTIGDISGKVNGWLAEYQPDFVLLMIGTNDVAWWSNESGAEIADEHAALVDQILAHVSADTWVLVASVPPESSNLIEPFDIDRADLVRDFNREMQERMQQRIDNGKNVVFVDVNSKLTLGDISGDGVHPNSGGYRKIARAWFEKLLTVLPNL